MASLGEPTASTSTTANYDNSSYREVVSGLHSLWADQKRQIETITDVSWRDMLAPKSLKSASKVECYLFFSCLSACTRLFSTLCRITGRISSFHWQG